MKPETLKQLKRFMDARDLLHSAVAQYETSIGALRTALDYAEAAMASGSDEETAWQISTMRKLVKKLARAPLETFDAISEVMGVRANEITAETPSCP